MTHVEGNWQGTWLKRLIREYLKFNPIAKEPGPEFGFKLKKKRSKGSNRRPDFALVMNDNSVPLKNKDRSYRGIYDLCLENMSHSSPEDIKRDAVDKKKEYARVGVREYYILDTLGEHTAFYRLNEKKKYEPIPLEEGEEGQEGDIFRSELLPGFAFRVNDLEKRPEPESLLEDPVYSPYLLLAHQKERKAKEKAQRIAKREKKAKEKERKAKEKAQSVAEEAQKAEGEERKAKEKERKAKEKERKAKEKERKAKEKAESKLKAMEKWMKDQGIDLPSS